MPRFLSVMAERDQVESVFSAVKRKLSSSGGVNRVNLRQKRRQALGSRESRPAALRTHKSLFIHNCPSYPVAGSTFPQPRRLIYKHTNS